MQLTLRRAAVFRGPGLHTGEQGTLTLHPAGRGEGILLTAGGRTVPLTPELVADTSFGIHARVEGVLVMSLEHVLGALVGLGLDNCRLELSGPEVPILDGSALLFARGIRRAGLQKQPGAPATRSLSRTVAVGSEGRYLIGFPARRLELTVAVHYDHPAIGGQFRRFTITPPRFLRDIAPARTFGWEEQIREQRKAGLVKGGHDGVALIYGPKGLTNPRLRRFRDEAVRHKALDVLGALALAGGPVRGAVVAIRPGHTWDVKFAAAVKTTQGGGA